MQQSKRKRLLCAALAAVAVAAALGGAGCKALSGYTLIFQNRCGETIEYAGFVNISIMNDPGIDFSAHPGGTENIKGYWTGGAMEFEAAFLEIKHIQPGESAVIKRGNEHAGESIALMTIDGAGQVRIIPVFYSPSGSGVHVAKARCTKDEGIGELRWEVLRYSSEDGGARRITAGGDGPA